MFWKIYFLFVCQITSKNIKLGPQPHQHQKISTAFTDTKFHGFTSKSDRSFQRHQLFVLQTRLLSVTRTRFDGFTWKYDRTFQRPPYFDQHNLYYLQKTLFSQKFILVYHLTIYSSLPLLPQKFIYFLHLPLVPVYSDQNNRAVLRWSTRYQYHCKMVPSLNVYKFAHFLVCIFV